MAINFPIGEPRIEKTPYSGWHVKHPSNDAIIAYCDTEAEAFQVKRGLEELGRSFHKVDPSTETYPTQDEPEDVVTFCQSKQYVGAPEHQTQPVPLRKIPLQTLERFVMAAVSPAGTFARKDALDAAMSGLISWTEGFLPSSWER